MKIVHLCQYYMVGHTYQENYLPQAMERLGHQVTVVAGTRQTDFYDGPPRREGDALIDRNVKVRYTQMVYKSLCTPVPAIGRILDQEAPDAVYVHGFILTRCPELRRWMLKHPQVKFAADTHETWVLAFNACFSGSLKDRVRRLAYFGVAYPAWRRMVQKHYLTTFYVSPPRKRYAMEALGYREEDLTPLWLGADFATLPYDRKAELRTGIRRRYGLPEDGNIVMMSGKLDSLKHPLELARAYASLSGRGDMENWWLFFVGSMPQEVSASVKEALSGCQRVVFTGFLPGEEVLEHIAAADLAAYPGAPSVLWQQTAALGVPAIYYEPVEGDASYMTDRSAAFVRRGDAEETEEALKRMTGDPDELRRMGIRARAHAEKVLSYDAEAEKVLEVFGAKA